VELVDGLIRDCLAANLPPLPAVLAEVLSRVLFQRGSATECALCFAQMPALTRERLEFLYATMQAPNREAESEIGIGR
jgi:hypothetical protein